MAIVLMDHLLRQRGQNADVNSSVPRWCRMIRRLLLPLPRCCAVRSLPTPWQQIHQPIAGSPQSIGSFANGCRRAQLPLNSPNYQVMRQDQRRYYGHPDLIAFIQRLSTRRISCSWAVLIGDMGMAAGGRFSSGHASHQTGLDVDIWLQLPQSRWTAQQLKPQPLDLVGPDDRRDCASLAAADRQSHQAGGER